MKYYSDVTKKFYEKESDCKEAEEKENEKRLAISTQRKEAADKIDELRENKRKALEAYQAAADAYKQALSEFCKKYGSYHYTVSGKEIDSTNPWRMLEEFLNW
jgi:uncharacterized coiled-coil DUF342 family protein